MEPTDVVLHESYQRAITFLQPFFDAVFLNVAPTEQFDFKAHPKWSSYDNALSLNKFLRGVAFCRPKADVAGTKWYPKYHFVSHDPDEEVFLRDLKDEGDDVYEYFTWKVVKK